MGLVLLGLAVVAGCFAAGLGAASADDSLTTYRAFEPGSTSRHHLVAGEVHRFEIPLEAGQVAEVVVDQVGLDVVVELWKPVEDRPLVVDGPTYGFGPEQLCQVAAAPGRHVLEVRALDSTAAGPYDLWLEVAPTPSARLRACHRATQARAELETAGAGSAAGRPIEHRLAALGQLRELWRQAGEVFPQVVILDALGRLKQEQGELTAAAEAHGEALALAGALEDRRLQTTQSNRLGLVELRLGEPATAQERFEDALALASELGDGRRRASALNNLALVAQTRGEHVEAIARLREALAVVQTENPGAADEHATFRHNLGASLSALGRYDEAFESLAQALERRRRSRVGSVPETQILLGWTHFLAGDLESAREVLEQARDRARADGDGRRESWALDRLGSTYRELGRFEDALVAHHDLLERARRSGNRLDLGAARANLGWLYTSWGRPREARDQLEEAVRIFESIGDLAAQAHVLAGLAHGQHQLGELRPALASIERARERVETLRTAGRRLGDRFRALPLWQTYDQLHLEVLLELARHEPDAGWQGRAFEVSDLARSRGLFEILREAGVAPEPAVAPSLAEERRSLGGQLRSIETRLRDSTPHPAGAVEVLERKRVTLSRRLASIEAEIRAEVPELTELRSPEPLSLAAAQALLDDDSVMLGFVLGEERSRLFHLTSTAIEVFDLAPAAELEALAWATWNGFVGSHQEHVREQSRAASERLSRELLGPVADALEGRRLIVVGDGILHYLPFAALPQPGREALLLDTHEVVYLPSLAVLDLLRQRAAGRSEPEGVAVLAVPEATSSSGLPDLPHARREAERIHGLASSESLLAIGAEATLDLLESDRLAGFRILHIAAHGILDEEVPNRSGLLLAPSATGTGPEDGFLSLRQIYSLDLPVEMVVLSSCRSALGAHVRGAGLLGLSRGFFYAGASRLVVSLWDVDDEATAELMIQLHTHLRADPQSPAAALRAAQQDVRRQERWRAPYYWAGFVLRGDWR